MSGCFVARLAMGRHWRLGTYSEEGGKGKGGKGTAAKRGLGGIFEERKDATVISDNLITQEKE